jgi:hypothetical protein
MIIKGKSIKNKVSKIALFLFFGSLFLLPSIIKHVDYLPKNVSAHSNYGWPVEIYTLWNDTQPNIDGNVNFDQFDNSYEWTGAALNVLFDNSYDLGGFAFMQNDDNTFYIGLDIVTHQNDKLTTTWGCGIYLDTNHDGALTGYMDKAIVIAGSGSDTGLYYHYWDSTNNDWILEEQVPLGSETTQGIKGNTVFTTSYFNESYPHRQYEIKIPFDAIYAGPERTIGIAYDAFEDMDSLSTSICWPYLGLLPAKIRWQSWQWGDIYFSSGNTETNEEYAEFMIEKNARIKHDAIGPNNGTYFALGDIDGDDDDELIVSSNRTASTSEGLQPLLAIFDYQNNEFKRIWSSWQSDLPELPFLLNQIVSYDFDGDGKDEIYGCGPCSNSFLQLYDWNETNNDFDSMDEFYNFPTADLSGYLTIGDIDNDGSLELVSGTQDGYVIILRYIGNHEFEDDDYSPFLPEQVDISNPYKIHAVEVANTDADTKNELLLLSQITNDDSAGITQLQILEKDPSAVSGYFDNPGDNLDRYKNDITEDYFGHTIVVEDVDNDGDVEIILGGKNYLQIYEQGKFLASDRYRIQLNFDSEPPGMAGGIAVGDLVEEDGVNELIYGCNNGSIFIKTLTESGSTYEGTLIWTADIGTSPGKSEAIQIVDGDEDGEKELIIGDNFGQMLIIGKTKPPTVSITYPPDGGAVGQANTLVQWEISDEGITLHHFTVEVNGELVAKVSGSQAGYMVVFSEEGWQSVTVTGYDILGREGSDTHSVYYVEGLPEVEIDLPENNYKTTNNQVLVKYHIVENPGALDHYEIYRNGTLIEETTKEDCTIPLENSAVYNITVRAENSDGYGTKDQVFVIKDNNPPELSITYPNTNSYYKGTEIELEWVASDELTEIEYFDIYREEEFYLTTIEDSCLVTLDLEKEYNLTVVAYDSLGNSAIDETIVTRDSSEPSCSILTPEDDFIVNATIIDIHWNATDNPSGSGLDYTKILVNGEEKYRGSGENETEISLGTTEGTKNIEVVTYDKAGNKDNDYVSVIVDVSPPVINILSPEDNYITGLNYAIITWDSSDEGSGIKEYQILVDNIPLAIISDPNLKFYQIELPENKTYEITVKSYDELDNYSEDTIEITRDSNTPTFAITNPVKFEHSINDVEVNMSWASFNIEGIEQYKIYVNNSFYDSLNDPSISNEIIVLSNVSFDIEGSFRLS